MPNGMEPYGLTDKALELLTKRAAKRFEQARAEAGRLGFDELNVIKTVKALYRELEKDNEQIFLELAKEEYDRAWKLLPVGRKGEKKPDRKWLAALLLGYSPVMKYVYRNEVERKRDRTAEAVNASGAKAAEFRRGLSYWNQMTGWFAVEVTDEAGLKAFADAGVKRVRWNTQKDGRECGICRERGGKTYPIGEIPPKPHPGCRCWFTPA